MSPFSEILDVVPRLPRLHQPPSLIPNSLASLHYFSFQAFLDARFTATFSAGSGVPRHLITQAAHEGVLAGIRKR